jgi:hypothetical protein
MMRLPRRHPLMWFKAFPSWETEVYHDKQDTRVLWGSCRKCLMRRSICAACFPVHTRLSHTIRHTVLRGSPHISAAAVLVIKVIRPLSDRSAVLPHRAASDTFSGVLHPPPPRIQRIKRSRQHNQSSMCRQNATVSHCSYTDIFTFVCWQHWQFSKIKIISTSCF